jgi:hypothetical protein
MLSVAVAIAAAAVAAVAVVAFDQYTSKGQWVLIQFERHTAPTAFGFLHAYSSSSKYELCTTKLAVPLQSAQHTQCMSVYSHN